MTGNRALITGATGFIGSHLVRYLLAADWQVNAVIRPQSIQSCLPTTSGIDVYEHSGTMDSMLSILHDTQPDVVFHLASFVLSEHQPPDIERLLQSNILFGNQLVEAMTQVGARLLVNTGTIWQHYDDRDYSPVNLYAATKQAFEMLLQYYTEVQNLRVITLELPDTYGSNDPRPKLLNLLRAAIEDSKPLLMSEGLQEIDLVHVNDVARAYLCAANRLVNLDVTGHEKFSITSGVFISLRELVSICEQVWDAKLEINWGARPYRKREVMKCWRGTPLPEWQAEIPLMAGLKNIKESFSSQSKIR